MKPAESIDDYAALRAALDDPFAVRSEVLANCGLSDAAFREVADRWTTALKDSVDLRAAFRAAFQGAKAGPHSPALTSASAPPGSTLGDAAGVDFASAPATPPAPSDRPRPEQPSYLLRDPVAPVSAAVSASDSGHPISPPASAADGTPPHKAAVDLDETQLPISLASSTLPFVASKRSGADLVAAMLNKSPGPISDAARVRSAVGSTEAVDPARIAESTLPFHKVTEISPPGSTPGAPASTKGSSSLLSAAQMRAAVVSGTEELNPEVLARLLKKPAVPFDGQDDHDPNEDNVTIFGLTLLQYASLCVDLARPERDEATVLARYNVEASKKDALHDAWESAMASRPKLQAKWSEACRTYRDWLTKHK